MTLDGRMGRTAQLIYFPGCLKCRSTSYLFDIVKSIVLLIMDLLIMVVRAVQSRWRRILLGADTHALVPRFQSDTAQKYWLERKVFSAQRTRGAVCCVAVAQSAIVSFGGEVRSRFQGVITRSCCTVGGSSEPINTLKV